MCEIKKINNIKTDKIISIRGKDDYILFEKEMNKISITNY